MVDDAFRDHERVRRCAPMRIDAVELESRCAAAHEPAVAQHGAGLGLESCAHERHARLENGGGQAIRESEMLPLRGTSVADQAMRRPADPAP